MIQSFCENFTLNNVVVIKSVMQCFEFVFRLKDNFYKSRFGRIGVKGEIIERYSSYFNYRILHHPFSLFGYVNGTNPNKKETWDPIAKFTKKFASRKHNA